MRAQFREICNTIWHEQSGSRPTGDDPNEFRAGSAFAFDPGSIEAANIAHRALLRSVSRIGIFWKVLLLLRRYFRGVRLARNTAWPE
jgi:hypothetical protein